MEEIWGQLVDDGINLLVCPGNHYSMSESPNAIVTGSILATALAFKYRLLFPEFPRPTRTFSQRRAVEKLSGGVVVFLHSKKGNQILVQCQHSIICYSNGSEIGVYASERVGTSFPGSSPTRPTKRDRERGRACLRSGEGKALKSH